LIKLILLLTIPGIPYILHSTPYALQHTPYTRHPNPNHKT